MNIYCKCSTEKFYIANRSNFPDLTEFGYKKSIVDTFSLLAYHRSKKENEREAQREAERKKAIKNVCVSCWTYGTPKENNTESYFMWKIYAGQGIGCRIESTVGKLLDAINNIPNDCDILLSEVKYKERWRTGSSQQDLFWKTLPYEEEKELRLCSLSQEGHVLLDINPTKMISEVLLSPFISKEVASWIKKQFEENYPDIPIAKSQIMECKK